MQKMNEIQHKIVQCAVQRIGHSPLVYLNFVLCQTCSEDDVCSNKLEILAWDDETSKWSHVGDMKKPRVLHGVSAIDTDIATINACKP